jgi:hypothetical protein
MPLLVLLLAAAMAQPVPQPFPRPGTPAQPAQPAPPPPAPGAVEFPTLAVPPGEEPTAESLGVPLYPGAQFIASYDAGQGQRFYLFGSAASFVTLVGYYRNVLNTRGNQVFDVPATHQFDIGRFEDDTMAFPPSVTVKDFESAVSRGYPNPHGADPDRFPTVIQVVPPPAAGTGR